MKVSHEDLAGRWSLSFTDIEFVTGKPTVARLGLAAQLKYFAANGFFVQDRGAIPVDGVTYLAEQLGCDVDALHDYDFSGRTARRHCAEILQHLGFRRLKQTDRAELTSWITSNLCPTGQSASAMLDEVFLWCRDRRISRMAQEDYRGLTPLIYGHVNPYGRFDLDLDNRIDFGKIAA